MRRSGRSGGPTRTQSDLAEMVEMLLDKGVVVNADIAVSVGDTELLGVEIRAAIASFETAAKYGLEFPAGTDREQLERAANGRPSLERGVSEEDDDGDEKDASESADQDHPSSRPQAATPQEDDGED